MTTPDIAGLCERLRAVESSRGPSNWSGIREVTTNWHRNPDGPPAANTLERQAAEMERLREAVAEWAERIDAITWTVNTSALDELISEMRRAALTGEDT